MKTWRKATEESAERKAAKPTRVGEIADRMFPNVRVKKEEGSHAQDFTYGNVWTRIWRNTRKNGEPYFRISFNRIDVREDEEIVRNNFTPDDLDDLMRAARRCKIWFNEKH